MNWGIQKGELRNRVWDFEPVQSSNKFNLFFHKRLLCDDTGKDILQSVLPDNQRLIRDREITQSIQVINGEPVLVTTYYYEEKNAWRMKS